MISLRSSSLRYRFAHDTVFSVPRLTLTTNVQRSTTNVQRPTFNVQRRKQVERSTFGFMIATRYNISYLAVRTLSRPLRSVASSSQTLISRLPAPLVLTTSPSIFLPMLVLAPASTHHSRACSIQCHLGSLGRLLTLEHYSQSIL